jgi:hypothetical protein
LQKISGSSVAVDNLFSNNLPLRITENRDDDDYVVPLNEIIGERILCYAAEVDKDLFYDAYKRLALGLAHYVNRQAILMRTPEARLSRRLLDGDKMVRPLLNERAQELYAACQSAWAWNSRFWEQRALLTADFDLNTALHYAKHAVALQKHPFTYTTLGSILLKQMRSADAGGIVSIFKDAFDNLLEAIRIEGYYSRITIHPYNTLFSGTRQYILQGGMLSEAQNRELRQLIGVASSRFDKDVVLLNLIRELIDVLE